MHNNNTKRWDWANQAPRPNRHHHYLAASYSACAWRSNLKLLFICSKAFTWADMNCATADLLVLLLNEWTVKLPRCCCAAVRMKWKRNPPGKPRGNYENFKWMKWEAWKIGVSICQCGQTATGATNEQFNLFIYFDLFIYIFYAKADFFIKRSTLI